MNALIDYTIYLADNALILGQRNAEWCGHGPVLEQDIALTNISLDLIGQARNFYQYAAMQCNAYTQPENTLKNKWQQDSTEDKLAYRRNEREFKNCLLVELPRGDWGQTILRQFFFSAYQHLLYRQLQYSNDTQLAAIAAKSLKEVTYHLRWSSEWVIRLGDGTEESHQRMTNAAGELWAYTGELFVAAAYEQGTAFAVDPSALKNDWEEKVKTVFGEAQLKTPPLQWMQEGGKQGRHTEHLGFVLAEMQYIQRVYPDNEW